MNIKRKMAYILLGAVMTVCMGACNQGTAESRNNTDTTIMKNEECLICGAPLEYLAKDTMMECELCHRMELSKTRCVNGHYVCDDCHTAGLDSIVALCMREKSGNPIEILEKMMNMDFCHMHGPEHHVLVGAALITAYRNAGGEVPDLRQALGEMIRRGKQIPGGACGYWGSCGAALSSGMFLSIVTQNSPLAKEQWGLCNRMTGEALVKIGSVGGPRCCKRDSYLSVLNAVDFVAENLGIQMDKPEVKCTRSQRNNQCVGSRCPFNEKNQEKL